MTIVADLTAQPESAPPVKAHVSYSALDGWLRCGKQDQLHRVLGIDGEASLAAMGGRAVHEATEAYDRLRFALEG